MSGTGLILDNQRFSLLRGSRAHCEKTRGGQGHIHSSMDRDCLELKINMVDQADLPDAQTHPEKHCSLLARVAGRSDYFVNLTPEIQNEIIKRGEHSAV